MKNPQESQHSASQNLMVTAIGVSMAAAAIGLMNQPDKVTEPTVIEIATEASAEQMQAIRDSHSVLNKVIVLKEGSILRSTPKFEDSEIGTNKVAEVGLGFGTKDLIVRQPLLYEGKGSEQGWIGFVIEDRNMSVSPQLDTLEKRAANTVWANYGELAAQGMTADTAFQPVTDVDTIPVSLDEAGRIYAEKQHNVFEYAAIAREFAPDEQGKGTFVVSGTGG